MSSISPVSTSQINQICENPTFERYLKIVKRSDSAITEKVVEPQVAEPKTLCFVSTSEQIQAAIQGKASIIIAHDKLKLENLKLSENQALYSANNISAAMALILPLFDQKMALFPKGIHPMASVDPTAQIGKNVHIGAFAVVGPGAQIGDHAVVAAQTVVEKEAQIGAHTLLHSHVFIGTRCVLGKHCEIHPHSTVGSDGFGYVQGHDQRRHKIPQLGIVVLEDFVELGASCAIDRATLSETRIGEGTKFDNFCHVAHNCKIGRNNVFAAGFAIAGSSEVGDNCTVAGNVMVADHVKIGSGVLLGGKSGVTKDIPAPGAYTGYPLEPIRDGLKTTANLAHVTKMRKQILEIRKHLGLSDEEKS
jgi:UDP-3-O-[3-hydroxymyristoyl] glucosamine N-acyltransferase